MSNDDKQDGEDERAKEVEVKSSAVMRYSAVSVPGAGFARLRNNTDLKRPPSNWLSGAADPYGLRQALRQEPGFSSFRMAHMFPDCVGAVDVVSAAECIKALLKLPYHPQGTISMVVHRVENTLLLDDFDIRSYLMKGEWSWMRSFLQSALKGGGAEHTRSRSRLALQRRSLHSKFLYYSLPPGAPPLPPPEPPAPPAPPLAGFSERAHSRNVLWTFEDIQMLVGSDMAIFGGAEHPCVSLRLRDAREPINVLTGVDYWLDNLMCNVPEVVMCYHLDGLVQQYEPIKTEDLPHLSDSKFSPHVIRDVAQSILSFLKRNATKAGHTYWLFKGADDEVVKLYDLTALGGGAGAERSPFTAAVALLLYRVARNMRAPCQAGHMRTLLNNCVRLLPPSDQPQVVASAHGLLADLHVPPNTDPLHPAFRETSSSECECGDPSTCRRREGEEEPVEDSEGEGEVAVYSLKGAADGGCGGGGAQPPAGLWGSAEERCHAALRHLQLGLAALLHYPQLDTFKEGCEEKVNVEADPEMARPGQPIPMGYQPLLQPGVPPPAPQPQQPPQPPRSPHHGEGRRRRGRRKDPDKAESPAGVILKKDTSVPTQWREGGLGEEATWCRRLRAQLLDRAALVLGVCAELHAAQPQVALGTARRAATCHAALRRAIPSFLSARAADALFELARPVETPASQSDPDESETAICTEALQDLQGETELLDNLRDYAPPADREAALGSAARLYSLAAASAPDAKKRRDLLRRGASVTNELGVLYMYKAQEHYQAYCSREEEQPEGAVGGEEPQFEKYSSLSESCLSEARRVFQQVEDRLNLALLYCNTGRFMRFRAHCNTTTHSPEQRRLYAAAVEHYGQALRLLREPGSEELRDSVHWELSSALFTRACLLQDSPRTDMLPAQAALEAGEALLLALRNCPLVEGPRLCLYQIRAAVLHHRLASLHHKQYRDPDTDAQNRKALGPLSELNYERALKLFLTLEDADIALTVQLEHAALLEYKSQYSPGLKTKCLQSALEQLLECEPALKMIAERESDQEIAESAQEGSKYAREPRLMQLWQQRVQFVLKSLSQLGRQRKGTASTEGARYRPLYLLSLQTPPTEESKPQDTALRLMTLANALLPLFKEIAQ